MLPDRKLAIIAKTFKEGKQLRSIFSEGLFAGMFVLFFDTQGHKIYYNVSFFFFLSYHKFSSHYYCFILFNHGLQSMEIYNFFFC